MTYGAMDNHVVYDIIGDETEEVKSVCFANIKNYLDEGVNVNQVKYYIWAINYPEHLREAAERFLEICTCIPFVQERVIEFTGIDYGNEYPDYGEHDESKYVLVDYSYPVDEAFTTLTLFRIPQEQPGKIELFYDLIQEGVPEEIAWVACLYYTSGNHRYPFINGHSCVNTLDINWWKAFLNNPRIAESKCDRHKTDVLGGTEDSGDMPVEAFINALKGENPCNHRVAVYGTLREGQANHALLSSYRKKGEAHKVTETVAYLPCKMYDTKLGFPAVIPSIGHQKLIVEVYAVSDNALKDLDALEGYPHMYNRCEILVNGQLCWMYYQTDKRPEYKHIRSGDWSAYAKAA